MAVTLLIQKSDLQAYRYVSGNLQDTTINGFILESQEFELRQFLGDDLYTDLLTNFAATKFQKLLNGEDITDLQNNKLHFLGLKAALAYFTLSKFTSEGDIFITATGNYTKENEYSKPLADATRTKAFNNHREKALSVLNDAKKYLDKKKQDGDFPNWNNSSGNERPASEPGISRIHRLSKNYKYRNQGENY